jgi:hypothetical protein
MRLSRGSARGVRGCPQRDDDDAHQTLCCDAAADITLTVRRPSVSTTPDVSDDEDGEGTQALRSDVSLAELGIELPPVRQYSEKEQRCVWAAQ